MTRLFVYGTLKRGCKNHHHIAGQTYLGEARTAGGYRLYDLGDYPGMVAAPDDRDGVTGELWEVDDRALTHLDDFEGVNEGLYLRAPINLVNTTASETASAHTYLYARATAGCAVIGTTWTE
ncbi:gamma-glutamylcyclotransferase family protein [Rariglobus hedericola]|uniref:Gamma-glutamylcyclotransferase family protein n=1 Tax=Rariglobus hedericola TaxID=2597822 RepID=A0A556QEM8_9BACT|nr:gamma-glutamylcyclotransferase family protein [Rariglobus hedericola]TSJ75099.1 gamma-glutamylcyclotransferase [Rariglobus hedericola]